MIEPPGFPHDSGGLSGPFPAAAQVDLDDVVELLLGHFAHGGVAGDSSVVDHDVERPERLRRGGEEPGHVLG